MNNLVSLSVSDIAFFKNTLRNIELYPTINKLIHLNNENIEYIE